MKVGHSPRETILYLLVYGNLPVEVCTLWRHGLYSIGGDCDPQRQSRFINQYEKDNRWLKTAQFIRNLGCDRPKWGPLGTKHVIFGCGGFKNLELLRNIYCSWSSGVLFSPPHYRLGIWPIRRNPQWWSIFHSSHVLTMTHIDYTGGDHLVRFPHCTVFSA